MYDEILLPTDRSQGAEPAVAHAIHLAKQNDAIIHAVYVLETSEPDAMIEDEYEANSKAGTVFEPIFAAAEDAGVEVVEAVLRGQTHEQLIEYIEEHDIDLVVMGTHGKSGLSRVLLGSTAEKVVRHSPSPVLTVRER